MSRCLNYAIGKNKRLRTETSNNIWSRDTTGESKVDGHKGNDGVGKNSKPNTEV